MFAMVGCSSFSLHAKTDFNVVGREMAGMLQNSHYARIPFDEKFSERILNDYLNDLDPAHLYFTEADIELLAAFLLQLNEVGRDNFRQYLIELADD